MHKYNIVFTDWFENINILHNKIDMYVKHNFDAESFYVGTTIRELCEALTTVAHISLIEVNSY